MRRPRVDSQIVVAIAIDLLLLGAIVMRVSIFPNAIAQDEPQPPILLCPGGSR